jgi:hypothetical protein
MADLVTNLYEFSDDTMQRLMKDLNYMFTHLDERNVKRLYTEYCNIQSEDGETIITGPLLTMRAEDSTTIRLKMGWDEAGSEFLFNLYTSDNVEAIKLNSAGKAEFRGNINTDQDIYVGNRIFLGWNGSTLIPTATLSTRAMYIMEPDTTKYMAAIYSTNVSATTDQDYEFEMESSAPMNITALERMRIYMYAGYDGVSTASINSTDYIDMAAWNNRMFIQSYPTTAKGLMLGWDEAQVFIGMLDDWDCKVVKVANLEKDYADRLKYFFMHNVRAAPLLTTSADLITNCHLVSSTQYIASTIGVRLYPLTTTISYCQADYNLATPLDFENFNDGTAMTSDDKLVMIVYVSSTSIIGENEDKVYFRCGNSSDVGWSFVTSNINFVSGWNFIIQPYSPDSIEGVPVMSAVTWARYGFHGGNTTTAYVIIDYVGVIRANSTDATMPNPFVRDYNSTNYNQWESYTGAVMLENAGKPAIVPINIDTYWEYDTYIDGPVQDFEFELDSFTIASNYMPIISAYIDADNYVFARVSSGTLRLSGKVIGSTFGRTINCDAFSSFKNSKIKLKRQLATWTASFEVTTDPMTYREIAMYNGPGSNWSQYAWIYIGHEDWDIGSRITGMKLKSYTV